MKLIIDVNTGYFDAKLVFESIDDETIKVSIPYETDVSRSKDVVLKKSNDPARFALAKFMMENKEHRINPEWSVKSTIHEYHLIEGWTHDEWLVEEWYNRQKIAEWYSR